MKWNVRKRDGVWLALDESGELRYAAADWGMAVSFALLSGQQPLRERIEKKVHAAIERLQLRISPMTGRPYEPIKEPPGWLIAIGREDPAKFGFDTANEFEDWLRSLVKKPPKKDHGEGETNR